MVAFVLLHCAASSEELTEEELSEEELTEEESMVTGLLLCAETNPQCLEELTRYLRELTNLTRSSHFDQWSSWGTHGIHIHIPTTKTPTNAPTLQPTTTGCQDGVQDGNETGVDCGGNACHPCKFEQNCKKNTDCESNACDSFLHTMVYATWHKIGAGVSGNKIPGDMRGGRRGIKENIEGGEIIVSSVHQRLDFNR